MASFDIVSKVDVQTLDNAINAATKEITTRFDFRDSKTEIELDKKALQVKIVTENEMRITAIEDVVRSRLIKQKIDPNCMDFGKQQYASGNMIRKEILIRQGIDKDASRKIMKEIKDSGIKVQAQMMDDQVRVTSKKIDDLQKIITLLRGKDLGIPIQFTNMK
jgi:cyclic-di-GMP-binding protein